MHDMGGMWSGRQSVELDFIQINFVSSMCNIYVLRVMYMLEGTYKEYFGLVK